MSQAVITFKPKQVTKALLGTLSDRARDIMAKRYGLHDASRQTLESIGQTYGITRERVRQIEGFSLSAIRKSDIFDRYNDVFSEVKDIMKDYGTIVCEQDFLDHISSDESIQNHIHFLLVLGDYFERLREDDEFHHRWTIDTDMSSKVERALHQLARDLSDEELVSEEEIIVRFLHHLKEEVRGTHDKGVTSRWLGISKVIGKNPLGEWGLAQSANVRARGIRDLAYLVLRQHGSPLHFIEVAKAIETRFGKKAHTATCHNELIKDPRFVLVGRGLYALSEWGYSRGVVRDVIRDILAKEGPLTKDEVIDRVLKERHVKENTILVNLQNSKYFRKDKKGRYSPAH